MIEIKVLNPIKNIREILNKALSKFNAVLNKIRSKHILNTNEDSITSSFQFYHASETGQPIYKYKINHNEENLDVEAN